MVKLATLVCLLAFLAVPALAQMKLPEVADVETGVQKSTFVDDGKLVMEVKFTNTKVIEGGKTLVKRKVNATWFLSKQPIPWEEESVIEIGPKGVRTLSWKKDSYGDENESWAVTYDWDKMKVHSKWTHRPSKKTKEKTLDLTDDVVTGDAFELILRGFPFREGRGDQDGREDPVQRGLVSARLRHPPGRGDDRHPVGEKQAYKLELKPTGLKGALAPAMYYYFAKEAPHVYLYLDGREAGPFQPRTKNLLVEFTPEKWVKK